MEYFRGQFLCANHRQQVRHRVDVDRNPWQFLQFAMHAKGGLMARNQMHVGRPHLNSTFQPFENALWQRERCVIGWIHGFILKAGGRRREAGGFLCVGGFTLRSVGVTGGQC